MRLGRVQQLGLFAVRIDAQQFAVWSGPRQKVSLAVRQKRPDVVLLRLAELLWLRLGFETDSIDDAGRTGPCVERPLVPNQTEHPHLRQLGKCSDRTGPNLKHFPLGGSRIDGFAVIGGQTPEQGILLVNQLFGLPGKGQHAFGTHLHVPESPAPESLARIVQEKLGAACPQRSGNTQQTQPGKRFLHRISFLLIPTPPALRQAPFDRLRVRAAAPPVA